MKLPHKFTIKTVPISKMRYRTLGDYWDSKKGELEIWVADCGNPDYNFLIAMHEMTEAYLAFRAGLTDAKIVDFDTDHLELDDPGSDPRAPYHFQHMIACKIEKILAHVMGIKMKDYDNKLIEVLETYK